ncbi:MAG: hypothetical protein CNC91_02065 [Flavobacteriales bacterium MED-G22]|nr:MAG: hypothetical protein CNC91_02065 [Flavobacteriales bacterium MED-G22]
MKLKQINYTFLLSLMASFLMAQNSSRVITRGVPFLMITPDARAAGMGDLGVATTADAYSQHWNPAKYVFTEVESSLGFSYTPYLSKLVNDIFLGNLTYYKKNSERSAWAGSLKYYSFGDIQYNELIGGKIIEQGTERPYELTFDVSYALKLSEKFGMSVAGRYIRSDLKTRNEGDSNAASSLGIDISGFYRSDPFDWGSQSMLFRSGFNISNIGPRLSYDVGGDKSFIPTNLKLGFGVDFLFDASNTFGVYTEFNKLLVPSPIPSYDESGNYLGYRQPDIDFLNGIITSFNDAQGGITEELQEITYAIGFEYRLESVFALRTGYFHESIQKGSRRYLTMGTGFSLSAFDVDISYLFSTSNVRSPLDNTLRFSLTLLLGNVTVNTDDQELTQPNELN